MGFKHQKLDGQHDIYLKKWMNIMVDSWMTWDFYIFYYSDYGDSEKPSYRETGFN